MSEETSTEPLSIEGQRLYLVIRESRKGGVEVEVHDNPHHAEKRARWLMGELLEDLRSYGPGDDEFEEVSRSERGNNLYEAYCADSGSVIMHETRLLSPKN